MNRIFHRIGVCLLVAAGLGAGHAQAGHYPIAPVGETVSLEPSDFLRSSPDCVKCNDPVGLFGVVGDNLDRHPGALWNDEKSFIGVFGRFIDFSAADPAIYLWESTGGPSGTFEGPGVELGWWTGSEFLPNGIQVQSIYRGVGVRQDGGIGYWLSAAVIPLSEFDTGGVIMANAVRVTALPNGHNQVIAVAARQVPEPGGAWLTAAALSAAFLFTRRPRASTARPHSMRIRVSTR